MRFSDDADHRGAAAPGADKRRLEVGRVLAVVTCLLVAVGFYLVGKLAGDAQPRTLKLNQVADPQPTEPAVSEAAPLVLVPQTEESWRGASGSYSLDSRSTPADRGPLIDSPPRVRNAERSVGRRFR